MHYINLEVKVPLLLPNIASTSSSSPCSSDDEFVKVHEITTNSLTDSILLINFESGVNNNNANKNDFNGYYNNFFQNQAHPIPCNISQMLSSPNAIILDAGKELFPEHHNVNASDQQPSDVSQPGFFGPKLSKFLLDSLLSGPISILWSYPKFIVCNLDTHSQKDLLESTEEAPNVSGILSIQYPVSMIELLFSLESNSVILKRDAVQKDFYQLSFIYSSSIPAYISILLDTDMLIDDDNNNAYKIEYLFNQLLL